MKTIAFLSLICLMACHSGLSKEVVLPNLPSFDMLLMDSTTILKAQEIPTGQPIILLFFRPDCPHCQQETRNLLAHVDSLRNVRIYLLAIEPFEDIKSFYLNFHLDRYKNFTVAKDHDFSFFRAFRPGSVPYTVIYDGNKRLIKIYNQDAGIETILTAIRS